MIEKAKAHGAGDTGASIGVGYLNNASTSTGNHQNHQDRAATATSSALVDFTLAAIRCERARTALRLNQIDAAGIGLRAGLFGPDDAIAMIEEVGVDITVPSSLETAA